MSVAHREIMYLCKKRANELFEENCIRNNDFYKLSKTPEAEMSREEYVNNVAPTLINDIRGKLAERLHPTSNATFEEREMINQILQQDTFIPNWRQRGAIPLRWLVDGTIRAMHRDDT